jgi:hypothetical protein
MTPAEVARAIESYNRRTQKETQEKASFDYIQAQIIVKGISVVLSGKGTMPTIQEAYPNIFDDVIAEQNKELEETKMKLSALRFRQFAQSYNNRYKEAKK